MSPIDRIRELLVKIIAKLEELRQKVIQALDFLSGFGVGWVIDKILDAWNALCSKFSEFTSTLQRMLSLAGNPWALDEMANQWDKLGEEVVRRANNARASALKTDDTWKGDSANNYRQILPDQKEAFDRVQQLTDAISGALSDVRMGVIAFWVGAGVALATLYAATCTAVVGAAMSWTGLALIAAIIAVAFEIGVAAVSLAGGTVVLSSVAGAAEGDLTRVTTSHAGFPNGAWPVGAL